MTFYSQVGSFTTPSATGSQPITGISFKPVAIIFWWAAQSANSGWTTPSQNGMGFATASGSGAVTGATATTATVTSSHAAVAIYSANSSGTVSLNASLAQFTSNGFTLNWTTTTSGLEIHYIALG